MEEIKNRYENASVVIAGAACFPVLFAGLHFSGWHYILGYGYPILCFWIGLILGSCIKKSRWWVNLLILCVTLIGLIGYRQVMDHGYQFVHTATMFLLFAGSGFLFPSGEVRREGTCKGAGYLLFLSSLVFCQVSVSVIHSRLTSGMLIPEHQDMERLMENLSGDAELLLLLMMLYGLVLFSFSKAGQWLGGRSWFRGIVLVPVIISFFVAFFRFRGIRFGVLIRNPSSRVEYLIPFLVQPLTIYLVMFFCRLINERRKKKGHLLLPRKPHKPNRIERMWSELKSIHEWNRMGGTIIYVEPRIDAIAHWPRIKREAEKRYIKSNKAWIKERRIGFLEAVKRIWRLT